jgi:VWFA-related protein
MKQQTPHLLTRGARVNLLTFLLLFVVMCAHAQTGASQEGMTKAQPVMDSRVSVLFTAPGKDKKFVATLKAEDIRVTADGRPQQVIELKRQADAPLFLVVAIDTSASQEYILPNTKMLADLFVKGMLLPGTDKAAVVSFTGETVVEQEMTADVEKVRAAIARVKFLAPPGYNGGGSLQTIIISPAGTPPRDPDAVRAVSTAMWDAVRYVSDEVMPRSPGVGRRAMLLITDGVDTSSRVKPDKAIDAALQSEVVVYSIGIGDEHSFDGVDKEPLNKIAERTGGRAFFPKTVDELNAVFKQIQEELFSQYVVTFAAPGVARDGSFHKIKIEITNPQLRGQKIELAVPRGYYVANKTTSGKR